MLVDGAKRDRLVWPGDMGIELPTLYLSLGPASGVREALNTIYDHQMSDLHSLIGCLYTLTRG